MHSIIKENYSTLELYQALRSDLMGVLTDQDLAFQLGGESATLGELCLEIGVIEQAYIESFKTFKRKFSSRNTEPGLETSVVNLSCWFEKLDVELESVVNELTEDDVKNHTIDCSLGDYVGHDSIPRNLDFYREALLIFFGKVSIYLRAIKKPFPRQWEEWIG